MRYFIKLAYNGTNYRGWQQQPNACSVQETLNMALSTILNNKIDCMGAGRTDAGVHAKQMFAHFDFSSEINLSEIIHKLNSYLPQDIVIYDLIKVHDEAHARFDAKKRTYEYHIHNFKDAFLENKSWQNSSKINIELMNQASNLLLQHTDFQCFSKVHTDVNTFDCKIYNAYWTQNNNQLVFTISADRFLRNMVRAIVGTLINVGLQKISIAIFQQILDSKDRSKAGFSVPAHGLYLTQIDYEYIN